MDAPTTPPEKITAMPPFGVPVIRSVNWGGLRTLYVKEVRRFFKVHLQTIWAPAATTLLFLVVFTIATGAKRPVTVGGVDIPFADFIAPGLIISQGMMGPAFANSSFSLLVGKIQGTIVDYLMPPLVDDGVAGGAGRRGDDARVHRRVHRVGGDGALRHRRVAAAFVGGRVVRLPRRDVPVAARRA